MKIAILGGGMVGSCYMQAFAEQGHTIVGVCDLKPSEDLIAQIAVIGTSIYSAPASWLFDADVVVSAVFGHGAYSMLEASLPYLTKGTLYVDMTTALPAMMVSANNLATSVGVDFVDVAITGAVNLGMRKTPLLIAGEKAAEVQALYAPFGARLTVVGTEPGNASKLKLIRSIFTKGIEALSVECLALAHVSGLTEELFDVLADIDQTPLRKLMESMVVTHIPHANRRAHEVSESANQMKTAGLTSIVLPGVQDLFNRTASVEQRVAFMGLSPVDAKEWLATNVLAAKRA